MAASFFEGDMAIFRGRSPRFRVLPAGLKLHPFGRRIPGDSISPEI
jgi:hypothetical protein